MNVFQTHSRIVSDYATYISSFIKISDSKIDEKVDEELTRGKLWPEPLVQFNPSFEMAGSFDEIGSRKKIHPELQEVFAGYKLYRHQVEAIRHGIDGNDFVVTSGTGSGKSLTYIATIFNHLLSLPKSKGVTAVVVYPMNALINSQFEELTRDVLPDVGAMTDEAFGELRGDLVKVREEWSSQMSRPLPSKGKEETP